MAPIQEGTYTIQRSSDHNYLVVSGGVVGVSTEDAYKWRIEASSDDNFFIADPVSGNYLWDNGTTGYRPNAVQSANSQWTGLSNGAPAKIYNKGTSIPLNIPYKQDGSGQDKWTLTAPP